MTQENILVIQKTIQRGEVEFNIIIIFYIIAIIITIFLISIIVVIISIIIVAEGKRARQTDRKANKQTGRKIHGKTANRAKILLLY